jgi:hypothetical protein
MTKWNVFTYIYTVQKSVFIWFNDFWCFNATISNISAISWRPVLVVEEAGVPEENHRPWASNWQTFLQIREWTHAVLVIGLYELLGNPTI